MSLPPAVNEVSVSFSLKDLGLFYRYLMCLCEKKEDEDNLGEDEGDDEGEDDLGVVGNCTQAVNY